MASDVATLITLGRTLIAEWGWESFCVRTLRPLAGKGRGVVDGVRHMAAAETVAGLVAPAPLVLVVVELDETVRASRIKQRVGPTQPLVRTPESEQQLSLLRSAASLIVSGGDPDASRKIAECAADREAPLPL